jgi:sugar phosphate isomerase/epimerase
MLVATAWTSAGAVSPMDTPAVSPTPITERVAAVAAAGYTGMGLIADDLRVIRDDIGFYGLRKLFDDNGFTHVEIELIERWWIPRGEPGHTYDVRDLLFDAADALQPSFIKIGSQQGAAFGDVGPVVPALIELADDAVAHGTRIAIETMPFSALATVPMGAELVAATGHPAVGLLVDAWHVFRAGTTLDDLRAALTPGMVYGVELDDAAPDVVGTLFEDTVERRLLCGDGTFDLAGLIAVLRDTGFDGPWGVEILSNDFRALPVADALRQAAAGARALLRA